MGKLFDWFMGQVLLVAYIVGGIMFAGEVLRRAFGGFGQ